MFIMMSPEGHQCTFHIVACTFIVAITSNLRKI